MNWEIAKEVVAAIGSIATAVGLLYLMYGDYFKRPVLEVSLDPNRYIRDQFSTPSLFHRRDVWKRSKRVRVCVVNRTGRRVARNARGFLIGAMPVGMSGPYLRNDRRPLPWQNDYHDAKLAICILA
jgi:hypothetical protein